MPGVLGIVAIPILEWSVLPVRDLVVHRVIAPKARMGEQVARSTYRAAQATIENSEHQLQVVWSIMTYGLVQDCVDGHNATKVLRCFQGVGRREDLSVDLTS